MQNKIKFILISITSCIGIKKIVAVIIVVPDYIKQAWIHL